MGAIKEANRMDNRQNNNQGNRRSIGSNNRANNMNNNRGNNNQGNNAYSKYGSNTGYNGGNMNRNPNTNYGNTGYGNNNGNTGYGNNSGVRYTDNTGYGNNGSNYNNRYSGRNNNGNYGQNKYDDIKGLSEGYEDYDMDMDNLEGDDMENPIDKKKLIKRRIILGIKIFCVAFLAAIVIGGLVIYMKYGKEIMQMRAEAKEIVANTTDETFTKTAQHKFYGVKTVDGVKKPYPLDMGLGNTQYISIGEGGQNMELARDLMVYSEDRNFYKHHGVDFWANVKAVIWMILKGGKAERGGSTITQQLVRNVLLEDFDKNWRRKVKEIFVSWELESKYQKEKFGKEKIVEFYLNNINFGNGYMGIENAALGYFGKSVKDLTEGQVAFLCAIPNNPSLYDPTDLTTSKEYPNFKVNKYTWNRKERLLGQLKKYAPKSRKLDDDVYRKACAEMIELVEDKTDSSKSTEKFVVDRMLRTYILKCTKEKIIENEVKNFKFRYPYELTTEAQRSTYKQQYEMAYKTAEIKLNQSESTRYIYTSLDIDMIEKLQKSIDEGVNKYGGSYAKKVKDDDPNTYAVQSAGVTMDNKGYVVAMVNGRTGKNNASNWLGRAFGCNSSGNENPNLARQPGSSIKPLVVYAPYFEENLEIQKKNLAEGKPITFRFLDEPVDDSGPYEVQGASSVSNSHNAHNMSKTVRDAIKRSSNVVAYRILENKDNMYNLGLSKGLMYLKKLNFSFLTNKENTRISLGGFQYGSTPLEMCAAYGAILNTKGHARPTCVKVISYSELKSVVEIDRHEQSIRRTRKVFSNDTRTRITEGMKGVFESGGTAAGRKPSNSQWEVAGKTGTTDNNVDAWFCGGTPKYTTSIWVGLDGQRKGNSGFSGPTVARIWRDYYNLLAKDKRICTEMNLESKFDEIYESGFGKVVYASSGSETDVEATEDPDGINATEDVTHFTFEPATQDPNTNPYYPDATQDPQQPSWENRPTIEPITEPPTDDSEDDDESNNNGNGNGFGNGNGGIHFGN